MSQPFLSIVIPAHNEASRLPPSLEQIDCFLAKQEYSAEVIVVENGSHDRTFDVAQAAARESDYIHVIQSPDGIRGKGLAVKQGMLAATGEWRFICDADLSMRIEDLAKFLPPATSGYDIVIASREAPGAVRVDEPDIDILWAGWPPSSSKLTALKDYEDTQCGFKLFSAAVAEDLFQVQRMNGIGFDVELLYIAKRRGYKVKELPITWYYDPYSTMRLWDDSINLLREIWEIRRNWRLGLYERGQ